MANSTVYPYGPGGSLPSSIGIIDDLTTGGADKALAAQQGVVLKEMIEDSTIISVETPKACHLIHWMLPFTLLSSSQKYDDPSGYNTGIIYVEPYQGQKITIVKRTGYDNQILFVRDFPELNDYAVGDYLYGEGDSYTVTVPQDARYGIIYVRSTTSKRFPFDIYAVGQAIPTKVALRAEDFVQGSLDSAGAASESTAAIRSANFFCINNYILQHGLAFDLSSYSGAYTWKAQLFFYKLSASGQTYLSSTNVVDASTGFPASEIPSSAVLAKLVLTRLSSGTPTTITPSDVETDSLYFATGETLSATSTTVKDGITEAEGEIVRTKENTFQKFTVFQWNIGHFSLGVGKNSSITGAIYDAKLAAFHSLLNEANADFCAIAEYSRVFGTDSQNTSHAAKDVLFQNYKTLALGGQFNYSCNALFTNLPLKNIMTNKFVCNQTAIITHTTAILATDYYYLTGDLDMCDKTVKVVTTHLAFDSNNPQVAQDQIAELIARYADEPYVIMLGDWNCLLADFDAFTTAGYTQANGADGYIGKIKTYPGAATEDAGILDNIVCKGVKMSNIRAISTELSDHIPILCDITL